MNTSIVLRRKQVAALLNVSLATLWRWGKAGTFVPTVRLSARSVGYLQADVAAWVASRERICS